MLNNSNKLILSKQHLFQYEQLVLDVRNFMSSVASADAVDTLVKNLHSQTMKSTKEVDTLLRRVELWEKSVDKFVSMLETQYPLYRDIVKPFVCAAQQVRLFCCCFFVFFKPSF